MSPTLEIAPVCPPTTNPVLFKFKLLDNSLPSSASPIHFPKEFAIFGHFGLYQQYYFTRSGLKYFSTILDQFGTETNCHHVCRPANQHSKEEWTGKRQKVFEGKVLRSRKKHQNLFQLHPPRSLLQLLHIAINHIGKGRVGWWWSTSLSLSPSPKASLPPTTYARQHKTNQNPFSIQIGRHTPSSSPPAPVIKAIVGPPAVCREKYSKVVQKSLDIKRKF